MIRNTSGQKIGAQMVSATDGSAFTGSVTVAVTVDAGTQATGSVGSGACTHEGNGYHTYAPAQGETDGDLVAFTFTGSGAVPVTVQVYTRAGDAFTRIGAGGAGLTAVPWNAAWDAEVQSECADALAAYDPPTNAEMEARTIAAADYATAAAVATVDGVVDAILVDTAEIGAAGAGLTALASAAHLATVDTVVDAIQAKTDNLPASPAAVGDIPTAVENADALLSRTISGGASGGRTVTSALRALRNKTSISGGTWTVCQEDDATPAWTATVATAAGDPITSIDPTA